MKIGQKPENLSPIVDTAWDISKMNGSTEEKLVALQQLWQDAPTEDDKDAIGWLIEGVRTGGERTA